MFLVIVPPIDFSKSSESKKSYLFIKESSLVKISPNDNTFFPTRERPPKVSK
jgi:hypothetical protein